MLRCLILMLPLTRLLVCLHCISDLRKKIRRSESSAFVKWRQDVFFRECLLFVTFFQETYRHCLLTRGRVFYDVKSWLHCKVSFSSFSFDCLRGTIFVSMVRTYTLGKATIDSLKLGYPFLIILNSISIPHQLQQNLKPTILYLA